MKTMTSEMSLRILADGELVAVAGARRVHCGPVFPPSKSVTQSNSVGDVTVSVSGNSGEVTVSLSQSNSAS